MNKLNVMVLLVALGLVVMVALAACGASSTQPTQVPPAATEPASQPTLAPTGAPALDGAALLDTRCSVCHTTDRVKQSKLTAEQWTQTVTLMISRGAKLTDAEKAALVEYLAKTYGP